MADAGYDAPRLAFLLRDLPVQVLARMRSDRVLPVIEGTVIRLEVEHLPSGATPKPVWLWWSGVDATSEDVDRLWQTFLRRFDIEHTFRLFKQTLGWTCPKIRTPQAADRWTWLILAAYTQLRLSRGLAADLSPSLGETRATAASVTRPRPPRISAPPRRDDLPGQRTETRPARTETPVRPPQQPPHPRHDVHTASGATSTSSGTPKTKTKPTRTPRPRRTG